MRACLLACLHACVRTCLSDCVRACVRARARARPAERRVCYQFQRDTMGSVLGSHMVWLSRGVPLECFKSLNMDLIALFRRYSWDFSGVSAPPPPHIHRVHVGFGQISNRNETA